MSSDDTWLDQTRDTWQRGWWRPCRLWSTMTASSLTGRRTWPSIGTCPRPPPGSCSAAPGPPPTTPTLTLPPGTRWVSSWSFHSVLKEIKEWLKDDVFSGAHFCDEDLPLLPDLLPDQAGAALHQGAAGHRAGGGDQVVCAALPQRQPARASGLRVTVPVQVSRVSQN